MSETISPSIPKMVGGDIFLSQFIWISPIELYNIYVNQNKTKLIWKIRLLQRKNLIPLPMSW